MGVKAAQYVTEYLRCVRLPWSQHQKDERMLWLCSIWPHGPMKKQAIAVQVRDYKNPAGINRPGRTHLWRHTCATHLVQGGANLAYVFAAVAGSSLARHHRDLHPRQRGQRRRHPAAQTSEGEGMTTDMLLERYRSYLELKITPSSPSGDNSLRSNSCCGSSRKPTSPTSPP